MKYSKIALAFLAAALVGCGTDNNPIGSNVATRPTPDGTSIAPEPITGATPSGLSSVQGRILSISPGLPTLAGEIGSVIVIDDPNDAGDRIFTFGLTAATVVRAPGEVEATVNDIQPGQFAVIRYAPTGETLLNADDADDDGSDRDMTFAREVEILTGLSTSLMEQ